MKILNVLMRHDYGVESRGPSYEYTNIHLPAVSLYGAENVRIFDFMAEAREHGREAMNRRLLAAVEEDPPDIALFCLFTDEIAEETVTRLNSLTRTAVYFFDDPWRRAFARRWIRRFRCFSTPDYYTHLQYHSEGITSGLYTPFGYNDEVYVRKDLPLKYEVSFVGGFSSYRRWVVGRLRKAGLDVHVFGRGWDGDSKWVSTPEMVDVFNQSAVNLNLSNGISYDVRHLLHALTSVKALRQVMVNRKTKEQVKGRHYEINGCGGFQLSYFVPGLNLVYEIDREIAVFEDPLLLAGQIKFFLKDDALRREIALNGYNRSIREHTSKRRLSEMYAAIMQMP